MGLLSQVHKQIPKIRERKKPRRLARLFIVLALPIFPASRPASIVGADELNFCVRDGNRWTLIAINTNLFGWVLPIIYVKTLVQVLTAYLISYILLGDPYRIRTDVKGVRGLCLNHLTNGPLVHLHGLEPGTH